MRGKCHMCGRSTTHYYDSVKNEWICSFCDAIQRKMWREKLEDLRRGSKTHYCKRCGKKLNRFTFARWDGYCVSCAEFLELTPQYKYKFYEKICVFCGLKFLAHNKTAKYCSEKCKNKFYQQKKKVSQS